METQDFILASASPQRLSLLAQIGYKPKKIVPADIDESVNKYENPTAYVKRMALEKAKKVASIMPNENILSGDTVVCVGKRILHKAHTKEEQTAAMKLLSGRACRVISAVCLIEKGGRVAQRCVVSRVVTKKLTINEIRDYVDSEEWVGCSGYKIEGTFAAYVQKIVGSYSGIVGLPLFETRNLLNGIGIK